MKTTSVRKLLPEAWGFLCPVHTPDGAPCGLLNHLTSSCLISSTCYYSLSQTLEPILISLGMSPINVTIYPSNYLSIFLDGKILGKISPELAPLLCSNLRFLKVNGLKQVYL